MYEDGPPATSDFELDAFQILQDSPDYNTGVTSLIDAYNKQEVKTPEAAKVLSDYSNDLRYRFKEAAPDISTVLDMAPVKPNEVEGEDQVTRINNWEQANLKALDETQDPDYLAAKTSLKEYVGHYASEARRDEYGDYGEGIWAWSTDKYFRGLQGAISPFAKLFGLDDLDKALVEHTQRSRDEGIAGKVAYGLGATVPLVAAAAAAPAVGIPAAAASLGVIGSQAAGEARGMYEQSLQATGDKSKALTSAALVGGAQILGMAPLARGANALVGAFSKEVATEGAQKTISEAIIQGLESQKKTFGSVAVNTLEAGLAGAGGQLLGNVAANIGLDQNGDITHGAADAFLANAIIGGGLSGAHALVENAAIEQVKRNFKTFEQDVLARNAETAKEAKPNTGDIPDVEPKFVKDDDGHWIEREETTPTVDERIKANEVYNDAYQEYVNKEPVEWEGRATTDTGEEVKLPSFEDYELDAIPDKTVITSDDPGQLKPGRFMTYMFGKLGGDLELSRNIMNGAFGSFQPSNNKIKILRSMGADPDHFVRTLAHEGGHFIDGYLNNAFSKSPSLNSVAEKLLGFQAFTKDLLGKAGIDRLARNLSAKWRPGWDGSPGQEGSPGIEGFNAYRNRPEEVYADTVSALLNNPRWVKENYPSIYDAFEYGLKRSPEVNQFWSQIQEFDRDPGALSAFNLQVAKEARQRQGVVEAAVRTNEIKNNSPTAKLQRNLDLAFQFVFNRLSPARKNANSLPKAAREAAYDDYNDISRQGFIGPWLSFNMQGPLKNVLGKVLQSEIEPNTWAQYEWAKRVRDEETLTMKNVENNPELYQAAGKVIKEFLKTEKGVKEGVLNDIFSPEAFKTPEGLINAFAKMGIIGDTAQVLSFEDFLAKYSSSDRSRVMKAKRDYGLAVARLNKRKQSIPIEKLRNFIDKLSTDSSKKVHTSEALKEALQDVTRDNAFAVRKFLVNAGGYTIHDAGRDLAHIQSSLGQEKFQMLEKLSGEYHEILSRPLEIIKKSGIFSPETIARFELNKGNYVTANVLKYFEGDDSVSAAVRTAIGSLSDTGNELNTTYLKMAAITARAYRQRALNAAIKLADMNGQATEVARGRPGFDIFAERDKLSKNDSENSYLIGYNAGKSTLYKISGGKSHERMFDRGRDAPVLNTILDVTDTLNKAFLTRQLKTILSPAFVLSQKFYDRKLEAMFANSFEVTGGLPIHTSGKLRAIDRSTKEEIAHYKKTGELTGGLKKAIDLDAAVVELSQLHNEGIDSGLSFSDAVYEAFGTPMPDEKTTLEKIGHLTESAFKKVGFGKLEEIASFDELRTKINGFKIGKEILKMSDSEAAVLARERFGIPDPLGGGVASPLINRMFLFGAAHLGGLRTLGSIARDMPKTAATQFAYRALLPKMLWSTPIMYAALKAFSGEEDAEKFKRLNEMIPDMEKISRMGVLLGAQDGQGNFHNFFDIRLKDIQADWKAWYLRMPQSRELTATTKVMWPLMTRLYEGEVGKAFSESLAGAGSVATGSIQPMLQYAYNLGELAFGKNPTDFYRMKGILNKDVAAAGSLGRKLYDYGKYVGAQQAPSLVPYNPFATQESKNIGETVLKSVPLVGPMARSMVGVSNYGLIEKTREGEEARTRLDAEIRLSTGDSTKELLQNYSNSAGQLSSVQKAEGKEGKAKLGPIVNARNRFLTSWHARVWIPFRNELRAAQEAGDAERYRYLINQLETSSGKASEQLQTLKSSSE